MDGLERRLVELNQALMTLTQGRAVRPDLIQQAQAIVAGGTYNVNTGSGNDTVVINDNECQGIQGLQGIQGTQGVLGCQGLQGIMGLQGLQGPLGTPGDPGSDGLQGLQGPSGLPGPPGLQGIQGLIGECQSIQGIQGLQGFMGPRGIPGPPSLQGLQGIQGTSSSCQHATKVIDSDYAATCNDYYIGVNSTTPTTIILPTNCTSGCEIIVKAEMGSPMGNRKITITTIDGALIDLQVTDFIIEVPYQSVHFICRDGDWYIV